MKERKAGFLLLFLLLNACLIFAQETGENSRIENSVMDTVYYCNEPVAVAPGIAIENIDFENASDGIKISIANYIKGEDFLFYTGELFSSAWNSNNGNLELTGAGTAEEYEEAMKQVFYESLASPPDFEPRSFSISLIDADYLPHTGHFYLYIRAEGIAWSTARDSAASMNYFGLQGYLATITSSVENDFIWTKIDGVGWIGGSDAESEGTWKWVTGPEKGTTFWEGNYTGGPVGGEYSFWNTNEPNNVVDAQHPGGEDYAHINFHPNTVPKSWNDLPNEGGSGYYFAQGFIVEFGGMENDPEIQLSASAVVDWSRKPEMEIEGFDSLVCGENKQKLNLKFKEEVSVFLRPLDPYSQVKEASTLSPTVAVDDFGIYRFELEITNRHNCTYLDTIQMRFQHQPTAEFFINDEKCKGYSLDVHYTGTTVEPAEFYWYSNDTVFASGMNLDSVQIPLGFGLRNRTVGIQVNEQGCISEKVLEEVYVTPALDFWVEENAEGCTPLDVTFGNNDVEDIDSYSWDFGDGEVSDQSAPVHRYENDGVADTTFDVSLKVVSEEGCENTGILYDTVTVHPIPTIDIDFDEATCYTENGEVNYVGSGNGRDSYLWDLSDFRSGEITEDPGRSSGPLTFSLLTRPAAEIGLQVVSEFGCKTDTISKTFSRKPVFEISPAGSLAGCPPLEVSLELGTTDSVDNVDYYWDMGDGQTATGVRARHVYREADKKYDIKVYAGSSQTGCADTLILPGKVHVFPAPEAAFSAEPPSALISDPLISFENKSKGATHYEWDFDDSSAGSLKESPGHRFSEMGIYDVGLSAHNDFGCSDSASFEVLIVFDKLFPPTAFSPNASREEDREFLIRSEGVAEEGYRLQVFNRWGEVIFESRSQEKGWDGRMEDGNFAPAGVYTWVIAYYDFRGEKHKQQGTVTLLF